jgi:ferredoxin, 2Fe-2S
MAGTRCSGYPARAPKVIFIEHRGTRHEVQASAGRSLLAALDRGVPGIDADCGGACACATCHVFIEPQWLARSGTRSPMEQDMLGVSALTQENSRLACQVIVSEALDGIVVRLPSAQH